MDEKNKVGTALKKKVITKLAAIAAIAVVAVVALAVLRLPGEKPEEPKAEVVTVSTLQQIIDVSELSTFTAVYNGIAQVMEEKHPEKIAYYVSYEADVEAGINFDQVSISLDEESKTFTVKVPKVFITDISVKIESLDFLFYDEDANSSTVSQEAYKQCIADVEAEAESNQAIHELALKNAVNVLTALLKPFVDQLGQEYSLVIE